MGTPDTMNVPLLNVVRKRQPRLAGEAAEVWLARALDEATVVIAIGAIFQASPARAVEVLRRKSAETRNTFLTSNALDSFMDRASTVRQLSITDAADLAKWIEEIEPGADSFEGGYVGARDALKMWKSSVLNVIWGPFRAGNVEAAQLLDELTAGPLRWARRAFERDQAELRVEAAAKGLVEKKS